MSTPSPVLPAQAAARIGHYTVIDVRTPGEYASGHVPGAHNVPLDHLRAALPALKAAAARGDLLMVCASGNRSATACGELAAADIPAATLTGGTAAWAEQGHTLHRPEGAARAWAMERQVRLTAGSLVLLGIAAGTRYRPARWLAAGIGGGLVFSALTDTCGMAAVLSKLPHNRPRPDDLTATLTALERGYA
ncbi:rhodanese-like domain-containing protein [Streptomyces fructofermentans]|uniref:Transporter n=1 Tax=Streptomyces fructofermentans TaxID=152141 RepID=A0A918NFM7_9ACTN|nr:rhodanese-like domain-containing protein [Streptomyces fructofermentans]GGX63493.1 transporter [Streptomyces fructofermentans]